MIHFISFFFFLHYSLAQIAPPDFLNGTPFTETSFRRFQEKMAQLSDIQQKIFHRGDRSQPIAHDEVKENVHPEEQPFLYQGDIVLTDDQMDEILENAKNMLKNKTKRGKRSTKKADLWNLPIPYFIDQSVGDQSILSAIQMWEKSTCITFRRFADEPINRNAIIFKQLSGCWSFVGQTGTTPQFVSIGIGCEVSGIVAHEIGHALGLFHEQSRFDREEYVKILVENISPSQLIQFNIEPKNDESAVSYDLGSIMHYAQNTFASKPNFITIATLDPNYQQTIGQRLKLSFSDIKKINLAYCSAICNFELNCQNGGYVDSKNCSQCRCPDGFGGILCEKAGICAAQCGVNDLEASANFQSISEKGAENCNYVITAPEGKKILFEIVSFNFTASPICWFDFLELKYGLDMASTGARLCDTFPNQLISKGNKLAVIYQGSQYSRFAIRYRYNPINSSETPLPVVYTSSPEITTSPPSTTTKIPSTHKTFPPTTTRKPIRVTRPQKLEVSTFFPLKKLSNLKGFEPFFSKSLKSQKSSNLRRFFPRIK